MMTSRTSPRTGNLILVGCLLLFFAACTERKPEIGIEAPEAKVSPTLIGVVSVFMKINNTGNRDDHLVSARTSFPGAVAELHDIVDGKMVKLDQVNVPAGGQLVLRPARHHIMIYKMPGDMKEGATFDLVLTFERSGDRTVHCEVSQFSSRSVLHK